MYGRQVFSADGRPAGCFGSEGSGPGKFRGPCGVAVDFSGRVLVVDGGNHRVQVRTWWYYAQIDADPGRVYV